MASSFVQDLNHEKIALFLDDDEFAKYCNPNRAVAHCSPQPQPCRYDAVIQRNAHALRNFRPQDVEEPNPQVGSYRTGPWAYLSCVCARV